MYREAVFVLALIGVAVGSILDGDLDLADGVRLVSVPVSNSLELEDGRSFGGNTVLFRMAKFLQGHELHVKLPKIIAKDKLTEFFADSLKTMDGTYKDSKATGRGKGGGGGAAALLGLLFGGALGAAGLGGVGLLAVKALAAAGLALMLSAIVGVKKMSSHDDHHEDHQVIYAGHHGHHRRRRDLITPLPYRGWVKHVPHENES